MKKRFAGIRPIRVLPIGFAVIMFIGAALLTLPAASVGGVRLSFFDALFTAVSASCVTGLIVVDTGTQFTLFGQVVILVMIQLGGLGFMTMAAILFTLTGRRISLHDRLTVAEGLGESRLQGVVALALSAVRVTFIIELCGAALLAVRFVPQYDLWKGLWFSIFHSVSAFCNAGFDLIGGYRSFTGYAGDAYTLTILMLLILAGGLGFTVLGDMRRAKRFRALRFHSKLVLTGSAVLLLAGGAAFYLLERDNAGTIGGMSLFDKLVNSFFESVTLRTAGFNSFDQLAMREDSKAVGILLMLVGGAPAGTAGGLKITTVFVLILAVRAYVRGKYDTAAFGRTVAPEQIRRAMTLVFFGVVLLVCTVIGISALEYGKPGGVFGIWNQLFEATSAFCTVGISCGVTAAATPITRVLLMLLMFAGRVGLLTVAMALTEGAVKDALFHYPEENVLIG